MSKNKQRPLLFKNGIGQNKHQVEAGKQSRPLTCPDQSSVWK